MRRFWRAKAIETRFLRKHNYFRHCCSVPDLSSMSCSANSVTVSLDSQNDTIRLSLPKKTSPDLSSMSYSANSVTVSLDSQNNTITLSFPKKTSPEVQDKAWTNRELPRYLPEVSKPWKSCREQVDAYETEVREIRMKSMEHELLVAGLFFTAVTTFISETVLWLKRDPADETVQLLRTIVQQLANGNQSDAFSYDAEFVPERHVVRVNLFFFLSLAVTLITALLCLMGHQWLSEHSRHVPLPTKDHLAVRRLRMLSMEKWYVPDILATIPILLELALVLFLVGLADLLWHTNHLVAWVFSVIVVGSLVILVATCFLPVFVYYYSLEALPCPYRSPQAWALHWLVQWVLSRKCDARLTIGTPDWYRAVEKKHIESVKRVDTKEGSTYDRYLVSALTWMDQTFCGTPGTVGQLFCCLREVPLKETERVLLELVSRDDPGLHEADGKVSLHTALRSFLCHHNSRQRGQPWSVYLVERLVRDINEYIESEDTGGEKGTNFGLMKNLLGDLNKSLPRTKPNWKEFPHDLSMQVLKCISAFVDKPGCLTSATLPFLWKINTTFLVYASAMGQKASKASEIQHKETLERIQQALLLPPKLRKRLRQYWSPELLQACADVLLSEASGYEDLTPDAARQFLKFAEDIPVPGTVFMPKNWYLMLETLYQVKSRGGVARPEEEREW